MSQINIARGDLPDFKEQIDRAGKLDQVDPSVADLIVRSGLADGDRSDDVVQVTKGSWPASALKPSQTSMVLGKALGMALLMLKTGKVGGDLGALVSKDKHILDGHHRWAATILASGSKGKVGGYGANMNGADLLKVLNVISKGLFGVRGGKPGKGSLAEFTPDNVRAMLEGFVQNGIEGEFPWSPESVQATLEQAFGSVEAGVDQIAKNANLITKTVPSWAPDRKQMPVIDPEKVPAAAKALSQGEVDWKAPYRKEGSMTITAADRAALLRLAQSLPVGDESRRSILAGLRRASEQEADKLDEKAEAEETQADADREKADADRMASSAALGPWKLRFPSHPGREALEDIYRQIFSKYVAELRRDSDPALRNHKELMHKAMGTFVTLLAQVKDAERALYWG